MDNQGGSGGSVEAVGPVTWPGGTTTGGALSGVRIIDLSKFWAGPAVTEVLANVGAEVLKIEAIQAPDPWRTGLLPPPAEGDEGPSYERSRIFNAINRNKYGLTLDLTRGAGREVFRRLVAAADVVVENYTPRVMPSFGLDYAALAEINPRLVMIALPAFGGTGPWRDYVGFAYPTEQASGFPHLTGYRGGRPMLWGPAGADAIAGMMGVVAVMCALEWRRRSGRGQYIDLSQLEAISSFLGPSLIDHAWNDTVPERRGNEDAHMAPHGCYPTADPDGWVVVAVEDDDQWTALCTVLGRPEWAGRPDLRSAPGRVAAGDELSRGIAEWTSGRDARTAMESLQAAGVAAGAVLSGTDFLADPQLAARGFIEYADRRYVGRQAHTGMWAKFSRTPGTIRFPAPTLGEHTRDVLAGLVGLDEAEIAALEADGITGTDALGIRTIG